jgi:uroporphyrinogen-III synthase
MASILLILRPEPGASATAERARAMGLEAVRAPLFEVVPVEWQAPAQEDFDALLMTSANAARHGGAQLERLKQLPCYAVGVVTADAARAAGWSEVRAGDGDAARVAEIAAEAGVGRLLHLCGQDHKKSDILLSR